MARLFLHGRVAIRPRPHRGAVHYVDDRVAILHDRSMDLNPAACLAARADLSPGLLSQIERGQGNPSLTTLIKLSQALEVPVGRFFGAQNQAGAVVRRDARRRLQVEEDNLVYELLTPHMQGQLGMVRAEIAAGWDNQSAPFIHPGEECVTMIEGQLYVEINGTGYELSEGDSLTYDSSLPHWYRNATAEAAVLIGAMTPPSF